MRRLVLAAVLLVAGCASTPRAPAAQPATSSASPLATSAYPAGATNPAVTQATIGQTICVPGWTATIRPNLPTRPGYEYDHLIPLELGGAPTDRANLTYIPLSRARRDDVEENRLHRLVCAHKFGLADAQARILAWKRAPLPSSPPSPTARRTTARPTTARPSPTVASVYYANCAAARAAGAAPLNRGEPGYRPALDRDNDGVACE